LLIASYLTELIAGLLPIKAVLAFMTAYGQFESIPNKANTDVLANCWKELQQAYEGIPKAKKLNFKDPAWPGCGDIFDDFEESTFKTAAWLLEKLPELATLTESTKDKQKSMCIFN
jgi:hypothetical protein